MTEATWGGVCLWLTKQGLTPRCSNKGRKPPSCHPADCRRWVDGGPGRGDEKVKDLEMNREKWAPSVEEEAPALWPPMLVQHGRPRKMRQRGLPETAGVKTSTSQRGLTRSQETEQKLRYVVVLRGNGAGRRLRVLVSPPGREIGRGVCVCVCACTLCEHVIGASRPDKDTSGNIVIGWILCLTETVGFSVPKGAWLGVWNQNEG